MTPVFWIRAAACLAAAVGAVVPQLEGSALGLVGLAHVVLGAAHLDLVEGAVGVFVVGAAVDGALDAGIGVIVHCHNLLVFGIQEEYSPAAQGLFLPGRIECVGGEPHEFKKQSNF